MGIIVGTGGAAQAAVTPPSGGGWAELYNPLLPLVNGRFHVCLDVPGGTTDIVPLQMYHCHGYASNGAPQRWQFVSLSDGSYWIFNQSNLMCVTARRTSTTATWGIIEQRPCGSFDGQGWQLVDFQPDLNFQLQSVSGTFANMCIASTSNGDHARVIWEQCAADAFQIFALG
jgi:hypothetical protein